MITPFPTCRLPACNRRATACEIDHTIPYDGANTITSNLAPLCPRHPHLKHDAPGWITWRDTTGTFYWRTPHGRVYRTPPDELPTADL
ncbi:MAG TPA: HNH endonuclease signature motif containing protein [Jatrophihabitans sp.]